MTARSNLALANAASPTIAPQNRGPLMGPADVARELFHGVVTARWCRDNVPGKIQLSHSKVAWYRDDVLEWIASRRSSAA